MHEHRTIHGDPTSFNLIVPHSDPTWPVWVNLLSLCPDVECPETWDDRASKDRAGFTSSVFIDQFACAMCHKSLDSFCSKHIEGHESVYGKRVTVGEHQRKEAEKSRLNGLRNLESSIRASVMDVCGMPSGLDFEPKAPPCLLVKAIGSIPLVDFSISKE